MLLISVLVACVVLVASFQFEFQFKLTGYMELYRVCEMCTEASNQLVEVSAER